MNIFALFQSSIGQFVVPDLSQGGGFRVPENPEEILHNAYQAKPVLSNTVALSPTGFRQSSEQVSSKLEQASPMMKMAQITNLDVECEKDGMTVNVQFSQPFDGVIYSKGHFGDSNCR